MDDFIPGIYNYCDRWCQRCPLSPRCRFFSEEAELAAKNEEPQNDQFWEDLDVNFDKALDLLRNMAKKRGIDLDKLDAELQLDMNEVIPARDKKLEDDALAYIYKAQKWFEVNAGFFEQKEEELNSQIDLDLEIDEKKLTKLQEAFEVIKWNHMFISAKIRRSLAGLRVEDFDEFDRIQNDSNGSAKIALIALQNSIDSWEVVRAYFPEKTDEIIDVFLLLSKIKKGLEAIFPDAMLFNRPGFDDVGHL